MADIAQLGIEIDTSGIRVANQALGSFTIAANTAGAASTKFGSATQAASAQVGAALGRNTAAQIQNANATTMAANAQRGAAVAGTQLAAANNNAAMATIRLSLANGTLAKTAMGVMGTFKQLAAIAAGGYIAHSIDRYIQLQNALQLAGVEGQELEKTENDLFEAANRTGQQIGEISNLYRRASVAAKSLGASNEDIIYIVNGVASALKIQGTSARQAQGVMLQFTQALGSGTVRAEEFNSIMEGGLPIAQAAARGWAGGAISVTKLRNMMLAGEVTSRQFFQALMKGFNLTNEQADAMAFTIAQSFTLIDNSFVRMIGTFDRITGLSKKFTKALSDMAFWINDLAVKLDKLTEQELQEFIDRVISAATIMTTVLIPAFVALGIAGAAAITRITVAMMKNPFIALITGVTALLVIMYEFRDEFSDIFGIDIVDVVKQTGNMIIRVFKVIILGLEFLWNNFGDVFEEAFRVAANAVIGIINWLAKGLRKFFYDTYDWASEMAQKIKDLAPGEGSTTKQLRTSANQIEKMNLELEQQQKILAKNKELGFSTTKQEKEIDNINRRIDAEKERAKALEQTARNEKVIQELEKAGRKEGNIMEPIAADPGRQARIAAEEAILEQKRIQIMYRDFIGEFSSQFEKGARNIKKTNDDLNKADDAAKKKGGKKNPYEDLIRDAKQFIILQGIEAASINDTKEELLGKKYAQELLNKAEDAGLVLSTKQREQLEMWGKLKGMAEAQKEVVIYINDLQKASDKAVQMSQIEMKAYGMRETEAAAHIRTMETIIDMRQKGYTVGEREIEQIRRISTVQAEAEQKAKNYKETVDFVRDTTKGFLQDMRKSLLEGASLWDALGNAAANALNKIADKLMDVALNAALTPLFKSGEGLLGGLIESLIGGGISAVPINIAESFASGALSAVGLYAGGGDYQAGKPRIVGEKGWEFDIPRSSGTIMNQQQLADALSSQPSIVIHQTNNFGSDVNKATMIVWGRQIEKNAEEGATKALMNDRIRGGRSKQIFH